MPSWNEKPHVTPTINVNLDRSCYCERLGIGADPHHVGTCPAKPIPIPMPLDKWRSVTFTVRLGECSCFKRARTAAYGGDDSGHYDSCPARPTRVSCSITGKTWAESEVTDPEWMISDMRGGRTPEPMTEDEQTTALVACRARWALVKALALGKSPTFDVVPAGAPNEVLDLFPQRDAVYAALADMARAEDTIEAAQHTFFDALHGHKKTIVRISRPSHSLIETYVERLIEQVGVLP